jgi:gluconate kinase
MKADMLRSQFEDLEPPNTSKAIHVSIEQPIEQTVEDILQALRSGKYSS